MVAKKNSFYSSIYQGGKLIEEFYNIDDRFVVDIGYGPEPSYIFYLKKDNICQKGIDIDGGYIGSIVNQLPVDGCKPGSLVYYYHIGEFKDDHLHVKNAEIIYKELKSIDILKLEEYAVEAYYALLEFVEEMIRNNCEFDIISF